MILMLTLRANRLKRTSETQEVDLQSGFTTKQWGVWIWLVTWILALNLKQKKKETAHLGKNPLVGTLVSQGTTVSVYFDLVLFWSRCCLTLAYQDGGDITGITSRDDV